MFRTLLFTFKHIRLHQILPLLLSYSLSTHPFSKVLCDNRIRFANKSEIIQILSTSKQQTVLVICNRQAHQQLAQQIGKIEDKCRQLGVGKVVLVDQTDIRHLDTFEKLIRDEVQIKQDSQIEYDMNQQLRIMYISKMFEASKPFHINSINTLSQQVSEIRQFLSLNPHSQKVKESIQRFNMTTVIKSCETQQCAQQFKEQIRKLIDNQLLYGKGSQYKFYTTTNKQQLSKLTQILPKPSTKEETYAFRNDMLGTEIQSLSEWKKTSNTSQLSMFIRPRVHILSQVNLQSNLYWFLISIINNNSFAFTINNTLGGNGFQQLRLLKQLHNKYKHKLQLAIINTLGVSQLIRHASQPWRYVVFKMGNTVPYPKMKLHSSTIFQQIQEFMETPKNYHPIKLYTDKQQEINGIDVNEISQKHKEKWILRVCQKNSCTESVYERYGIDLNVKVYKVDRLTNNIGLEAGDYWVENGNFSQIDPSL